MTNLTGPRRVGAWPRWRPRAAEMSLGRKEAQEIASRCCTLRRAYRRADAFGRSPKHFMRIFAAKRIGPKNRILHRGHRERGASQSILPQITQMPQITIPREWFYLRSSASSAVKESVFVFLRVLCGKNSGSVLSVPCKQSAGHDERVGGLLSPGQRAQIERSLFVRFDMDFVVAENHEHIALDPVARRLGARNICQLPDHGQILKRHGNR